MCHGISQSRRGLSRRGRSAKEEDEEKAKYYWELAAMRGVASSRHNLVVYEENAGNMNRAMEHYNIAAGGGGVLRVLYGHPAQLFGWEHYKR